MTTSTPSPANNGMSSHTPQRLSGREIQVLKHVMQGKTNRQIGHTLSICEKTVEFHLHNTYAKVGVRSRTELSSRLRGNVESDHDDR